jgi:hypothetical protein
MPTKIIQLKDGTLVEAFVRTGRVAQTTEDINKTIEQIKPILIRVSAPISAAWKELSNLDVEGIKDRAKHFALRYLTVLKGGAWTPLVSVNEIGHPPVQDHVQLKKAERGIMMRGVNGRSNRR